MRSSSVPNVNKTKLISAEASTLVFIIQPVVPWAICTLKLGLRRELVYSICHGGRARQSSELRRTPQPGAQRTDAPYPLSLTCYVAAGNYNGLSFISEVL